MGFIAFLIVVGLLYYFLTSSGESSRKSDRTGADQSLQARNDQPQKPQTGRIVEAGQNRTDCERVTSEGSSAPSKSYWPRSQVGLESHTHLAGAPYYIGGKTVKHMSIFKVGQTLCAVRESTNPKDSFAVRLTLNGETVGYIPSKANEQHANHMDGGGTLLVSIERVTLAHPWKGVKLLVKNL